jgi:hypothetical protein
MNRRAITDRTVKLFAAHPYLITLAICLGITPFTFGAAGNIPENALWIELFGCIGIFTAFILYKFKSGKLKKATAFIAEAAGIIALCFGSWLYNRSEHKPMWMFIGGCVICLLIYLLSDTQKYKEQLGSFLMIAVGFFLKLYYVMGTSCYTRQHDVGSFDGDIGHSAYIEYLYNNHALSDFDVRTKAQFCHPPFHHAISALWLFVNEKILGISRDPTRESVQMLTLFYSMCIIITAYKILKYFKLKGKALYIPLIIVSMHPCFILFSGSINNDVLSVALETGAVIAALKWYEKPTMKGIIKIALCIGLGMMTKLSAALIAPPVAAVFLYVLIKNFKKEFPNYFKQYAVFGVICVPLGLWFGIRNYIKWKVPITYVHEIPKDALQYLGEQSFVSRITDFSLKQVSNVYEQWADLDEAGNIINYNEYNPIYTLLKNSIFGEYINESCFMEHAYINKVSVLFFWLSAFIAAFAFIAMIVMCIKKTKAGWIEKWFVALFYVTMMASFYKTAADYPFTCTMNFRYITPTVITGALFIGLSIDILSTKKSKAAAAAVNISLAVSMLFALCTCLIYLTLTY